MSTSTMEKKHSQDEQKTVSPVAITPPPQEQRVQRNAVFAEKGARRDRYSLPSQLDSPTVVGYRTRMAMTQDEIAQLMPLLSLSRPDHFEAPTVVSEQELFEESALGILSARQSTNYLGHKQVTLDAKESKKLAALMRKLNERDAQVLDNSSYTHVVFSRPYRTAFTLLLTLIGHKPFLNLLTVPLRALRKKFQHIDDIPTIGYLQDLHIGILADAMERAAVLASGGVRKAQVHMRPFCTRASRKENRSTLRQIEDLCGLTGAERRLGWRVALVAQVGHVAQSEHIPLSRELVEKASANLLAFRSERIQPGVNQDDKAPSPYQKRQDMDVSDPFTEMAGRASFNAFSHWTQCSREEAKQLLLLERIDVLTPGGKERIRDIRTMLEDITDKVVRDLPLWADLPTGRAFSRTTARGKKAFALAGQRIYIGGLSRTKLKSSGIPWELAVRAVGASSARSALFCEWMGVMDLPDDCDLLAGVCMMAGPVNQNDIGKCFYGYDDLLAQAFPNDDPTSLLVWTMKAKTVTDPIGNEEQLMNPKRKGKLVDLRPGPHQVIQIQRDGKRTPMRLHKGTANTERAFGQIGNFVKDPAGKPIPGNEGEVWSHTHTGSTLNKDS